MVEAVDETEGAGLFATAAGGGRGGGLGGGVGALPFSFFFGGGFVDVVVSDKGAAVLF